MYIPYNSKKTSKLAAKRIRPIAPGQKFDILKFILASDAIGVTAEEVSEGTRIKGDSVRPRLLCLEADGSIRRSGRTRKTKSGREAEVWVACEGASLRISR